MKPSAELHLEKAESNYAAYEVFAVHGDSFRSWQVTTLFYSALHWVQSYVMEFGLPVPDSHYSRGRLMRLDERLTVIAENYSALKDMSMIARYHVAPLSEDHVKDAVAAYTVIKDYLYSFLLLAQHEPTETPDSPTPPPPQPAQ